MEPSRRGLSNLIKGNPESSLFLLPCGPSPHNKSAGVLILEFPALKTIRTISGLSHPVYDILLQQPERTETEGMYQKNTKTLRVCSYFWVMGL